MITAGLLLKVLMYAFGGFVILFCLGILSSLKDQ